MHLRHIHLPSPTPYSLAAAVQESLRRTLLTFKDHPSPSATPPPALLTFTPPPTYTLGRRQTTPLSQSDTSRLTGPLTTPLGTSTPQLISSPRGGLTTYHGPGQLVLWPVVDIRSGVYRQFSVKSYACLLEKTTVAVLSSLFGVRGFTTSDPGVWVISADGVERKVAAMGVHLRRHITSLGTAINLDFPRGGDEGVNPWARFVPCGLEGKEATSLAREVEGLVGAREGAVMVRAEEMVARAWAEEFARGLGVKGVVEVGEEEMEAMRLAGKSEEGFEREG